MKYLMMCCALIAAAAVCVGPVAAQTNDMDNGETMTGTVVSVSDNTLVITSDDGRRVSFNRDATSIFPTNLAAGQRVRVEYDEEAGGAFHVTDVTLLSTTGTGRTNVDTDTGYRGDMPTTASPFPLLGLLGVVALGAGLSARGLSRRGR
jgi:hypothetical protein